MNATSEPLHPLHVSMKFREDRTPSNRHSLPQPKSHDRKKGWSSVLANLFPAENSSRRSAMLRACLDILGDADDQLT